MTSESVSNFIDPKRISSSSSDIPIVPLQNPLLTSILSEDIATSSAVAHLGPLESGIPRLTPPNSSYFPAQVTLKYSEIVSSVLDLWEKNIQEVAIIHKADQKRVDRQRRELKIEYAKNELLEIALRKSSEKDLSISAWQNGLAALFALYGAPAHHEKSAEAASKTSSQAVSSVAATGIPAPEKNMPPELYSSAIASTLMIGAGISATAHSPIVGLVDDKLLQNAWSQIAAPHQANTPVTQSAGWLSALWGIGLTYFTAAQEVGEIEKGNKEPLQDLEFAVKYAENLLKGLRSEQFRAQMRAIILANVRPGEKIDLKDIERLTHTGKIILLTVALAQIMKLELSSSFKEKLYEGHITGDEVIAMLEGKINFQTNDPHRLAPVKAKLIVQINNLKAQISEAEWNRLIRNMKSYFDTNPSVEKLSSVNKTLGNFFAHHNMEERHLEQNPM